MVNQISDAVEKAFGQMISSDKIKRALDFIEADQAHTKQDQIDLVQIEAPTGHEEKRAEEFAKRLKALGLENVHIDRGGNVVGLRRGSQGGLKILVEAHLDTVFPFGTVEKVEEKDGFIYAPGIGDDTRALAMLLSALRAINDADIKTIGDIVFVGTTREEGMGSLGGMKDFLNDNPDIDIAISVDNNDMSNLVFEATSGKTVKINFYGIGGHAFGAFGKVAQPINAAARAVAKMADFVVPSDPKTSFCISNFHGGNDAGIHAIAPMATIKINFRSNSPKELQILNGRIYNAVEEACREETNRWGMDTITWDTKEVGGTPGGAQPATSPLVEAAYCGLKSLGIEPVFAKGGCTNANISIAKGIPAICIGRAFAPDEESKNVNNHSIRERFPLQGADKPVKLLMMTIVMAAGLEGQFPSVIGGRRD